jgi:hypothetical protein
MSHQNRVGNAPCLSVARFTSVSCSTSPRGPRIQKSGSSQGMRWNRRRGRATISLCGWRECGDGGSPRRHSGKHEVFWKSRIGHRSVPGRGKSAFDGRCRSPPRPDRHGHCVFSWPPLLGQDASRVSTRTDAAIKSRRRPERPGRFVVVTTWDGQHGRGFVPHRHKRKGAHRQVALPRPHENAVSTLESLATNWAAAMMPLAV